MPNSRNKTSATKLEAFEPHVDVIDRDASVVLAFRGIMCFCQNTKTEASPFCEIGIHSQAPGHSLQISVMKVKPGFDPPAWRRYEKFDEEVKVYDATHTGNSPEDIVEFRAVNARDAGVKYFKYPATMHRFDIRRVPDLEGEDFYGPFIKQQSPPILPKVVGTFGPMVHVYDGLFYSWVRSKGNLKRQDKDHPANDVRHLGRLAQAVAANIYLNAGGSVSLKIKGVEVGPLQPTADYKYLVFVDNLCPKDICKDIDFDLYLKTFEKPGGAPTFEVAEDDGMRLKDDGADLKDMEDLEDDAARDDFFADANQLPNNRDNKSNDDTPCAASGFGSSGCIHC